MVAEVVAGEGVDEVDLPCDVGDGDGDDLAIPGRLRESGSALEQDGRIRREQCGGDQGRHVVTGLRSLDDLGNVLGAAHRELMDHVLGFGGHGRSIDATPDTGLTRGIGRSLRR